MPIRFSLLLAAGVLQSASAVAQARPWYSPGSRLVTLGGISRVVSDTMGTAYSLQSPAAADGAARMVHLRQVFGAVAAAYTALKIPLPVKDSTQLLLGNPEFYDRYELGGKSLALYLDCGQDINGSWAEIYRIQMSLVTFVTPKNTDEIEIRIVLLARAVDIPRAQPNYKDCRNTGELERRIFEAAAKPLTKMGFRAIGS